MRTVRGRALPVSSGQSPMPSIWCDYAAWRANESSCVTRQNALVPPVLDLAVNLQIDGSATTEMHRDRETKCREEVRGEAQR